MEINYQYYTDTYGGSDVTASEWLYYSNQAINKVNYQTFNKASRDFEQYTREISNAICRVSEHLKAHDTKVKAMRESDLEAINRGVKSETVKSHSKTYEVSAADTEELLEDTNNKLIARIVREYLLPTGLLYRGL